MAQSEPVTLMAGGVRLSGDLTVPAACTCIVLFAHGSGSSRLSPRNTAVARLLNQAGLGTLLFDLLTDNEAQDRANVFNIALLARRLISATDWVLEQPDTQDLQVAYFGASTGAAAALLAAAHLGQRISAVVSRGGRPDLAAHSLGGVVAPTLLIVGSEDDVVLDLNRGAFEMLRCTKALEIIPGATHLFEEPGALDQVADLAADWFQRFAGTSDSARRAQPGEGPAG